MEDTDYSYLSLRMMLYGASKNFKSDPIVGPYYGNADNNYPFLYMLETNFHQINRAKISEILYVSAFTFSVKQTIVFGMFFYF